MNEAVAIEVSGLSKRFKGRRKLRRFWRRPEPVLALQDVALRVHTGELVTLLGPNGAGKTTLLKIVSNLVEPTTGAVMVMGRPIAADPKRARAMVGYVLADERSFYWRITCRDNLLFFAALCGLSGQTARHRIEQLAALVGLQAELDKQFHVLSTGQRQRLAIARGLIADPPVLLFDEATRSLDPGRARRFRRMVREVLVDRWGKGVLFATHDLHEAEVLADRVVLMSEGRVACEGNFSAVKDAVEAAFDAEAKEEDEAFLRAFPGLLDRP